MASETVKALLMITLFCGLQVSLHLPRLINSRMVKRCRRAMILYRPDFHMYAFVRTGTAAQVEIAGQAGRKRRSPTALMPAIS